MSRIVLLLICFVALPFSSVYGQILFASEELIELSLNGDLKALFNDREDDRSYHPVSLSYLDSNSDSLHINLKAKTRGNSRRKKSNCFYPPILLNFDETDGSTNGTLFENQNELKLVTPCKQDNFVIKEFLVYKIYNLFTDYSFIVRLAKIKYNDTKRGKTSKPLYGFILEDQDKMAERNNLLIVKPNGLKPNKTSIEDFHRVAVFEYLIGNTDWSVQYRHNIKLISDAKNPPITVPYDFDRAGIVSAPYALPSPALELPSVRVRRYRGYCQPSMMIFESVFKEFNEKRLEIEAIYTKNPYLDEKYKRWTKKYLDGFYDTINNPKKAEIAFRYPCNAHGTGNVVISGLK